MAFAIHCHELANASLESSIVIEKSSRTVIGVVSQRYQWARGEGILGAAVRNKEDTPTPIEIREIGQWKQPLFVRAAG